MDAEQLSTFVRDVPDFPKPGIVFKDITPLLADPVAFSTVIDLIVLRFGRGNVDKVCGIEARGFIVAAPVAYHFGAGFVPVRKLGKLPAETIKATYALEYGTDSLEMHRDAISPRQRVLIVDDLLATGGTAEATVSLVRQLGGDILSLAFLIELAALNGRARLEGQDVHVVLTY